MTSAAAGSVWRVTFADGRSVRVRVAADAGGHRESERMVARRRAADRRYRPGTIPEAVAARALVVAAERIG